MRRLVKVIVEVSDAPALPFSDVAEMVKSPTWTVITVELVTVGLPPDPFSVTS